METCSEGVSMGGNWVRDAVCAHICRLRILAKRVWTRRDERAARRKLAALSPWLKKDLGVGQDGRPLDRRV